MTCRALAAAILVSGCWQLPEPNPALWKPSREDQYLREHRGDEVQ